MVPGLTEQKAPHRTFPLLEGLAIHVRKTLIVYVQEETGEAGREAGTCNQVGAMESGQWIGFLYPSSPPNSCSKTLTLKGILIRGRAFGS